MKAISYCNNFILQAIENYFPIISGQTCLILRSLTHLINHNLRNHVILSGEKGATAGCMKVKQNGTG